MRTNNYTSLNLIITLVFIVIATSANGQGTIKTPMGQTVNVISNWDTTPLIALWESQAAQWIINNSSDAQKKGPATSHYNCHAYAWHISEGGSSINRWINQTNDDDSPNLSKYWTNDAYVPTSTPDNHQKLFYASDDHSAITTDTLGWVKSKWGWWGLYEHSIAKCPFDSGDLHYYKLVNPSVYVPSSTLCNSSQQTVSESSFTDITLNYDWNVSGPLTEVSGDGSAAYTVASGTQNGMGLASLTITTPSGASSGVTKNIWVGAPPTPEIESYTSYVWSSNYWPTWVKVYTVYTGEEIYIYDENTNIYGAPVQDFTRTWDIDGGAISYDVYDYGTGGKLCYFYEPGSVRIRLNVSNSCDETGWSEPVFVEVIQQEYLLSLSPNPVSDEATVELKSNNQKQSLNDYEWDMEVFDQSQMLKAKVSKIKGSSTKIQTSGWKDGVYIVRAKIGNQVVTGKLVVKH